MERSITLSRFYHDDNDSQGLQAPNVSDLKTLRSWIHDPRFSGDQGRNYSRPSTSSRICSRLVVTSRTLTLPSPTTRPHSATGLLMSA